jgi:hypothetical protein
MDVSLLRGLSSPFKREVVRGMGSLIAIESYPHPNPPLEGEGTKRPYAAFADSRKS